MSTMILPVSQDTLARHLREIVQILWNQLQGEKTLPPSKDNMFEIVLPSDEEAKEERDPINRIRLKGAQVIVEMDSCELKSALLYLSALTKQVSTFIEHLTEQERRCAA